MKFICAAILVMMATTIGHAQWADSTSRLGLFVGGAYHFYDATFTNLPGMNSCCPEYSSATGIGGYGGLEYGLPLSSQWRISMRAGYASFSGAFSEEEFIGYALDGTGQDARVVQATSEHALTARFSAIELAPRISFRPFRDHGLGLHGMIIGQVLFGGTYETSESLLTPQGGVFSDTRTATRGVASGDITNLSGFVISAAFGVHVDVQLGRNWWLTPEISYVRGLMNVADLSYEEQASWTSSSLRGGLTISTAFMPTAEPAPIVKAGTPSLSAGVSAVALAANGTEQDVAQITIEETLSTQVYPLLPMVFFDENVSRIKTNTYRNLSAAQAEEFNERTAFTFDNTQAPDRGQVTLDVYRNVLNIIGKRLRDEHPEATLTIIGCNSDVAGEQGNTQLSRERAEAVRQYLTSIWDIDTSRLTIEARGLPANASKYTSSSEDRTDALEENRRVEFASTTPELFFPVVINDTLREISPPRLKFRLYATGDQPLADWQLVARQPAFTFLEDQGRGAPPENIVWARSANQRAVPRSSDPIVATFSVSDSSAQIGVGVDSLAVDLLTIQRKKRERRGTYSIDQYRLSLFEYEQTELTPIHRTIIDRFIRPSIPSNAIVIIDGYTDRKGDAGLNLRISQQRATAVADALPGDPKVNMHGEGTDTDPAPFNNDTPEGRLYNRTVNVTIMIPAGE